MRDGTEKGEALSVLIQNTPPEPPAVAGLEAPSYWFAVQTRARHEKKVNSEVLEKGINSFLPLHRERRRWSDRSQWVEVPLFSQYLFVRLAANEDSRIRVLQTAGVLQFVGGHGRGTPIPDEQIESLRAIVDSRIPATPHEFLRLGERVRIRGGGAMNGLEGILVAVKGDRKLVVSVEIIQRSVAIQLNGFEVERV
jgi:transcriptional antiterminator NusG